MAQIHFYPDIKGGVKLSGKCIQTKKCFGLMNKANIISVVKRMRHKVAVAMSGGIDSSVSALKLKEQGFDVIGIYMRNWDVLDEDNNSCNTDIDEIVSFVKEYWTDVFLPFLDSYGTGIETPNPDVHCNRFIKFRSLQEYVQRIYNIDYIATGHYCRIFNGSSSHHMTRPYLLTSKDSWKDQTYFLSMTEGKYLKNVYFPIGDMLKDEVRDYGHKAFQGLNVLNKKESTGICFVGERNIFKFLTDYISVTPGRFIDVDTGREVGRHQGAEILTTGQRARISGCQMPYYIVGRSGEQSVKVSSSTGSYDKGDVLVCSGKQHPALFSDCCLLALTGAEYRKFNWIQGIPPEVLVKGVGRLRCFARTRHGLPFEACEIEREERGDGEGDMLRVKFDRPSRALTVGQILALYIEPDDGCLSLVSDVSDDYLVCIGGGPIITVRRMSIQ